MKYKERCAREEINVAVLLKQISDSVIHNMTDGFLVLSYEGYIVYGNQAAYQILGYGENDLTKSSLPALLRRDSRNDLFLQLTINEVKKKKKAVTEVVPYYNGKEEKHLRVTVSVLQGDLPGFRGLTIVMTDLSEMIEMQDAVRAMEHIDRLNRQLKNYNDLLSRTFGMFLSDEVVKELLETPDGLTPGGKKKTITVMMSDIRGFTAMSEKMDADELISMLNHYLAKMTDIIQKRGGTIIEFLGDGILTIFGAPVYSETHATDAVATALEMEAAMDEINLWNTERGLPHLEMGIGIDSGEVIVGNIGSEKRMKYGVVGKHVNMCSRIESYTVGGQILVSPAVRSRISVPLQIERELTVLPKGAEKEMVLSHVTGLGDPYNITVKTKSDVLRKLSRPLPVCFYRLDAKHTMDKPCYGGLVSVGRDSALLQTTEQLGPLDNIQMEAGGKLMCKVVEDIGDDTWTLQYTSIPSGYERWIEDAC